MAIGKKPCPTCSGPLHRGSPQCVKCYTRNFVSALPEVQVASDREKQRASAELSSLKARYAEALKTIEQQESTLHSVNVLGQSLDTFTIEPHVSSGKAEGTVVMCASDWHLEEKVGAEVGGLNTFNLD